ncbi:MAG: SDR family NAD(P)-dependent oxidoreductase [Proteobacteria bacterium]|jgi:NAD(P)-dependent dehydrogenase (short-subunit alcohol dehydrogenase family)|nr:SDR family NAD(P)-dependent oxidoreductase [Pseudomonadota bacterium]
MERTGMTAGALDGQVAIVTGAGTGIGRASAVALAAAGAKVALSGRRKEPLDAVAKTIHDHGHEAIVVPGDVSKVEDVDHLFTEVVSKWHRVDVLFANAGTNTKLRNIHDIPTDEWNHVVAVNLSGAFYTARRAIEVMRAQGGGTIINLVSMAAKRAGALAGVAYSASKAGQHSLTQSINEEERHYGIRATSIFPGEVDTDIMDARPVVPSADARATMLQPEDVAATVVLIASLPSRVLIEELMIKPSHVRDQSGELRRH